jgi:excisionase family DNA binding protein
VKRGVPLPPRIDPHLVAVLLFTKPQMAAMLQVSIRCLTDMMKRGEVTYLRLNGRLVRFRAEDVLRRLSEVALVNNAKNRFRAAALAGPTAS